MLQLPEYYTRVQSMPDDPKDAVPLAARSESADIFVMMFPVEPFDAMPYEQPEIVIEEIHKAMSEKQGLIEVETGNTSSGNKYIYSIVKTLKEPEGTGVQYTLTCNVELPAQTISLQGFFDETGMTGFRDNTIFAQAVKEGIVGEDFSGWFEDPYDPEYRRGLLMNLSENKAIDAYFPAHPLSLARELMQFIIEHN